MGQEDLLDEEMATHSSILAWEIPCTEDLDGLHSVGLQSVGHNWATNTHSGGMSSGCEGEASG